MGSVIRRVKSAFAPIFNGYSRLNADEKIFFIALIFFSISYYTSAISLLLVSIYTLIKRRNIFKVKLWIPYAIFALIAIVSPICYGYKQGILIGAVAILPTFVLSLFAANCIRKANLRYFFRTMVMFSIPTALYAIGEFCYNKIVNPDCGVLRVDSTFANANIYAVVLMAVLMVAFALLADKAEKPCRPWLVPAIILNLMALYLTNTRMIWPALIAGLILQFILLKKYKTLCFVLGTCVVGLVVIIVAPELFPRLSYSHVEENYNERRTLWMTAVNYIKGNPVFGQGALSFREHVWKTWPRRTHPHNLFLTLWVDYGFFGMLALICATVMSIATSIKIQIKNFCNVENAVFLAYIIGIFIFGITDNPVINLGTGFVFSFMMAVPYIVKNNELVNNGQ